jgi:two-component system sensor histidine kinase DegS
MILSQSAEEEKKTGVLEQLRNSILVEQEKADRQYKEVGLLLEQSQQEIGKLAQRNTDASTRLQQIQAQFETRSKQEIRTGYDSALDAQQRLFVMRGQIEKLQSDRNHLDQWKAVLDKLLTGVNNLIEDGSQSGSSNGFDTFEMLIQAQEAERQRLSRQMHDEPAQALSNFILQTEIAMRLFDIDQARAKEELGNLKNSASTTFRKVRDFIFELRPMMLDDLGLPPTVSRYVENFKAQTGQDVRLSISGMDQRMEPYVEVMLFRAMQELLSNAAKHSQASQVKVQIDSIEGIVRVTVDDNGKGFDVNTGLEKGMGLKIICDRVKMLNGRMEIDSVIGQGTRVTFEIPARKTKVFV